MRAIITRAGPWGRYRGSGGFGACKPCDGLPGWRVFSRGWKKVYSTADSHREARRGAECGRSGGRRAGSTTSACDALNSAYGRKN